MSGMNKRYKQKEIKLLLQQNKASLAGLIETRIKEVNIKATLKAIPTRNGFESLMHNKMASLSINRGGASKTC